MSGSVPIVTALSDVYPEAALTAQGPRWRKLLSTFEETYGRPAGYVARSPGRVNIIGEHIDYSLYSVLPMAITADALVAVAATPVAETQGQARIRIANIQPDRFPPAELAVNSDGEVDIDASKHDWTNYFKSGLRGALQHVMKSRPGHAFSNMDVLVDGNVPVGGGLSSSAAVVSASSLAVLLANADCPVDKRELTELAIVSERAVGVNSGGMDQAASVFSEQGAALLVSFTPRLSARPVSFPPTRPELCFVVAQSFVTSNKQVTGPVHYNLRVVEVTLAAACLNALLNPPGTQLPSDAGPLGTSLRGFHETYFYHQNASDYSAVRSLTEQGELQKLIDLTKQTLVQEEGYTKDEMAKLLGISVAQLEERFLSSFPVRADRFKLRQRALHVFSEALRVLDFLTLLERPLHSGASDTTRYNSGLGALLNQTQDSCRLLYECSCPEIDQICTIAREAGAYASRLTGAGWGGCTVHMVPADKVEDVRLALDEKYYAQRDLTLEQREGAFIAIRSVFKMASSL
ncbi:hypothetical protein CDD81_8060 [Ophiocordyceps australis]|uniref:Galactokinase n=1 Tax=Ophiocordyceps australis TaxID=1399860 RepID=A0A2C5X8R9_9HYPO|nr:hypothetical protein CDD81_8060 [Ophiocordyceps australis]